MQLDEARRTRWREALFGRLVRLALARAARRRQHDPAQEIETVPPGRQSQRLTQIGHLLLIALEFAHFEQAKIGLHVAFPSLGEKPGQRLARLADTELRA